MSSSRKQWVIPQSYDIGVHFYFWNLLKGSEYVQKFLKENVALIDRDLGAKYKMLFEGQSSPSDWMMSYDGFIDMLDQAGLDENIVEQIKYHIDHIAGGIGKDIHYLKVKEFLAYCGIDGVYDLENKKHFVVEQSDFTLPKTIDPKKYRVARDCEKIREHIAYMMDGEGALAALDRELLALEDRVWGDYLKQDRSLFNENTTPEERQAHYFKTRPDLAALQMESLALRAKRDALVEELKDKYAPMDEAFTLPKVGTDFDKNWYDKGEYEIGIQKPFRERFAEHMEKQGKRKGDPEYDSFSWKEMRLRSFSIFDYAIRDFTMNSTNRGEIADHRRYAIPRAFVRSVRAELEDGLLEALKLPYRIEKHGDGTDSYAIVCNDCEAEIFTLEQLAELEKQLAEEDAELAKNAPEPKPSGFMPPPPAPVQPELTEEELAEMAAERLASIRKLLTQPDGSVPNIEVDDPTGGLLAAKLESDEATESAVTNFSGSDIAAISESDDAATVSNHAEHSESFPAKVNEVRSTLPEEIPDEDLPFPEAGLMEDMAKEASDEASKHKDTEDVKVLEFENVLPLVPPKSQATAEKEKKAPARDEKKTPQRNFEGKAKQAKESFGDQGNGFSPRAFGGNTAPYANPYQKMPKESALTVGLGFGIEALGRGLKSAGRSIGNSMRGRQEVSLAELDSLGIRANNVVSIKNQIASGVDVNGALMTSEGEAALWKSLNNELDSLQKDILSSGKPKAGDSAERFKDLAKKMRETTEFAKSKADSQGQIGDLAKQAQKIAEEMAGLIAKLLDGISKMFSRSGPK